MLDITETTETPETKLAPVINFQVRKRTRDKLVCQKEDGVTVELFINGVGAVSMRFIGCVQENTPTVPVRSLTADPIVEDTGCPDYLNLWPAGV